MFSHNNPLKPFKLSCPLIFGECFKEGVIVAVCRDRKLTNLIKILLRPTCTRNILIKYEFYVKCNIVNLVSLKYPGFLRIFPTFFSLI